MGLGYFFQIYAVSPPDVFQMLGICDPFRLG